MKKIFLAAALIVGVGASQIIGAPQAEAGQAWAYKYASYCDYCNKLGNRTLIKVTAGLRDFRGTGLEDPYPDKTKALAAENCPKSPTKHHSFTKIRVMHFTAPAGATSTKEVVHIADQYVESEHFFHPPEMGLAVLTGKEIEPPPQFFGSKEPSKLSPEETAQREKLKEETSAIVTQADAKYKAKDYTAAKELFSQAIKKNPHDYHTHDLYARSMYREKSKDKNFDLIISEMKTAIGLAPDNKSKADCYGFLAKVYRKLAMDNLFNMDNKIDYTALAQECDKKELALRRG
ncbi:MAG: hypothetical protein IJR52_01300 [Selenomonadaceae bacterium]|nr:hypothetical protein [Selenomonadaceae bacterium]MBQ9496192.1 hypothetical protein [Selenomonadaceae bacterium]